MPKRKWLTTGIVAGSVGLGAVLGAAAFAPGLGLAQSAGQADTGVGEAVAGDGWCFADGEDPISVAADAIGIPPGDLLYAMRDGKTIAEVADAEGVDEQVVIDALIASMQDGLAAAVDEGFISQDLADRLSTGLEERATSIVNGDLPFMHGGPMMGGHGPWGGPFMHQNASGAEATSAGLF